jgi:hypothetical protein
MVHSGSVIASSISQGHTNVCGINTRSVAVIKQLVYNHCMHVIVLQCCSSSVIQYACFTVFELLLDCGSACQCQSD